MNSLTFVLKQVIPFLLSHLEEEERISQHPSDESEILDTTINFSNFFKFKTTNF